MNGKLVGFLFSPGLYLQDYGSLFIGPIPEILARKRGYGKSIIETDSVSAISHFLFPWAQRRAGLMRRGQRARPQKRRRSPRYSRVDLGEEGRGAGMALW